MGKATIATFFVALVLFISMGVVQHQLGLGDFRFGSKWTFTEQMLDEGIKKDPAKPPLVVVPLLFPLDFLFLIFFGATLAMCSLTYADALVPTPRIWLLLILPIAYMVADFSENVLYSGMLLSPGSIPKLIDAGNWATRVKLLAGLLAIIQAVGALLRSRLR
jgi:hypothetical protein